MVIDKIEIFSMLIMERKIYEQLMLGFEIPLKLSVIVANKNYDMRFMLVCSLPQQIVTEVQVEIQV